ncbi:hypothetical protein BE18_49315, partial [Sorangium cellulosum]
MRAPDGAVPRTKIAVLMGLTAALFQPLACAGEVVDERDQGSSSSSGFGGDIAVAGAYGGSPSVGSAGGANPTGGPGGFGGDIAVAG